MILPGLPQLPIRNKKSSEAPSSGSFRLITYLLASSCYWIEYLLLLICITIVAYLVTIICRGPASGSEARWTA